MTTAIAIFTGILTAGAAFLAWRQLKAAQPESIGRRMGVAADRLGIERPGDAASQATIGVSVTIDGPAVLYGLRARFTDVGDGMPRQSPVYEEFTCQDELQWEPTLPQSALADAWLVVSWAGIYRDLWGNEHLVSQAVRTKVDSPRVKPALEVWHYTRFYRLVSWYHRTNRWYLPWSGRKKPLGRYKPYVARGYDESQGPVADPSN